VIYLTYKTKGNLPCGVHVFQLVTALAEGKEKGEKK
jgi:hypothetical protein